MKSYKAENLSGKNPLWYWDKTGEFHDAKIISVNEINLNYDYSDPKPVRNYYEIEIKLVNTQRIRFYNSKIIRGNFKVSSWWLCDTLKEENDKFILYITVCDNKNIESVITIKFDYAEVL